MIPALILLLGAIAVLLVGLAARRGVAPALRGLALAGVAASASAIATSLARSDAAPPLSSVLTSADPFFGAAALCVLAGTGLAIALGGADRTAARANEPGGLFLALLAAAALLAVVGAESLLVLSVAVATAALCFSLLVCRRRGDEEALILGALPGALIVLSAALLFGATRELRLDDMATALGSAIEGRHRGIAEGGDVPLLVLGLALGGAAFAMLLGTFPLHGWTQAAWRPGRPALAALLELGLKGAAAAGLFRLARLAAVRPGGAPWVGFAQPLAVLALAGVVWGALGALRGRNPRSILAGAAAYRSGVLLAAVLVGAKATAVSPADGTGPAAPLLLVVLGDGLALVGLAAAFSALSTSRDAAQGEGGAEGPSLADLRGLGRLDPGLALAVVFLAASLAGLPPGACFWGRLWVLRETLAAGGWIPCLLGAAAATALALGALRIATTIFLEPEGRAPSRAEAVPRAVAIVCAAALLVGGLFPEAILALVR